MEKQKAIRMKRMKERAYIINSYYTRSHRRLSFRSSIDEENNPINFFFFS